MRITRPFVLLALAALLAPRIEASRTGVWERNPPAAAVLTTTDAAGLLASLAPAARLDTSAFADAEAAALPLFNLGDIVLVDTADADEDRFHLGPLELLGPAPLRGPPSSYPETRVGGFELLPPFRIGASPTLSLWSHQACGSFSCGLVSDSRYDPWGLSFWSSIQGYVAGITEEADPTGLLPEVESIDAGYHTGSRDAEDFDASKTAGKWTLRGLTALKAGAQKAGKFGIKAITSALKSEAKQAATTFAAGVAGDATEQVLLSAGVDEDAAKIAGKVVQYGAPSLPSPRRLADGNRGPRRHDVRDPKSGRWAPDPAHEASSRRRPRSAEFTEAQRKRTREDSRRENDGSLRCERCEFTNPLDEYFHVDHPEAVVRGGGRDQKPRILCVGCNTSNAPNEPKPGSDYATRFPEKDERNRLP